MSNILDELTAEEVERLRGMGADMRHFSAQATFFRRGKFAPHVIKGRVRPPRPNQIGWIQPDDTRRMDRCRRRGIKALRASEVGVILLNGGMATRFGGQVKGVVDALPGCSFLQLKAEGFTTHLRPRDPQPPVVIMNSVHTDGATRQHLDQNGWFGLDQGRTRLFMQSALPHLHPDGKLYRDASGNLSLYGPGHGDLLPSLKRSGMLDWLRGLGVEMVLASNVDNLGATLDPVIVGHCLLSRKEMVVEVVTKDHGDVGGAPVDVDGYICVVEDFALPNGFDRSQLSVFNTNTLWFRVDALGQELRLDWYLIHKTLGDGTPVVQFEALIGQASWFLKAGYIGVDRATRFLPVKTPEDLQQMRPLLERLFERSAA